MIYSYFEWEIVNKDGKQDYDGEYMFVRDIWVHKDHDGKKEIGIFIDELDKEFKNRKIKYIYWRRIKKGKEDRVRKPFKRNICLRRIK